MRYLVIGSGGREHAIAWKLSTEADSVVFVAPGSDGIATTPNVSRVDISADDHAALANFAHEHHVNLTVVGPEAPLVAGLADHFRAAGLAVVGPSAGAAMLEGSKAFAKEVMKSAGVPTAGFETFSALEPALEHVRAAAHPLVIKADGLAGGKGVVISESLEQSESTLQSFMAQARFGAASSNVVIEDCLVGPELSFMVVTDGDAVVTLSTSRDHKRLSDNDEGPNTGGMGAVTPSPDTSEQLEAQIVETVIRPTLVELRRRGLAYCGFLYAGMMLTPTGPMVLEFNVRLGDPETQALLFAMEADLGPTLLQAATGELSDGDLSTARRACCVVLASEGYPQSPTKGDRIAQIPEPSDEVVTFHAGTARDAEGWVTAGGRVLGVTARGRSASEARNRAYETAETVRWRGRQMRSDIGS